MPQDPEAARLIRTEAQLERCKLDFHALQCHCVPTCTVTINLGNSFQVTRRRTVGVKEQLLHTMRCMTR